MVAAAALALSCLASACSPGLGNLKTTSHDAGNPDSGGSGGTAGVGGTAGSAGTDASTAGSGGTAGTDAGDAGTFTCSPKGGVFDVLTTADLGGAPIGGSPLLVVDGAATNGAGSPNAYVVVAADSTSNATWRIVVRTVVDAPTPQGPMITFDATQQVQLASGYATSTALHVLGWRGVDTVDWTFPLGVNGNLQQPTTTVLSPSVCTSNIAGACFMRNGSVLHEAVTCFQQSNGNPSYTLYFDGQLVDSGPSDNLVVHDCLSVGSTFVLRAGGFLSPQLRYGQTAADLHSTHAFALTASTTQPSELGQLAATPSNDGMVLLAYNLANATQLFPIDIYSGALPISKLADLDQIPVPELSKRLTVSQADAFYTSSHPDVGQKVVLYAGYAVSGDKVALTAVGTGGKLLAYGIPVYAATNTQTNVAQTAVGMTGPASLVAWDERDPQGSNDRVRGQAMLCAWQ